MAKQKIERKKIVSVIVATKNEENNIVPLFRSIRKQSSSSVEIETILVDNFSQDKSVDLAKPYADEIIISGPERSSQKNIGARKAKGSWLLFLDADMRLSGGVIKECLEYTKKSLFPPIVAINEEGVGSTFWGKALALERKTYKASPSWILAARFFPKKIFLDLGGFDKNLIAGEDWDLTQRFINGGVPIFITKRAYITHIESKVNLWQMLKKEYYYIKNIGTYAKKQPFAFSYQQSLLYRFFVWLRSWRLLLKYPIYTFAFLFYKSIVWLMWQYYENRNMRKYVR